ncbi:hypothetical protein ACFQ3P_16840 [Paraburkholderia sabiae]|uniref:Uncharacterized protein n=1 Tax=Paraburkholderia sabiae TaxID=273251 RepID=A0ABU9QA24_9BURK|nr:hypothetical protein [Paraburkholderia sabiae]WJZ75280.1 hypothetical protein QEN71_05610 [Paraburkholderia sabiae]CAD6534093.1 hypothetical protein LMG24235_02804 [Paraburkholderia sabiae]
MHCHAMCSRRLKRLETKKAGEASLWIAPINGRDLQQNNRQAFLYKNNPILSGPKATKNAMPGRELNANEGLMLLERRT